MSTKCYAQVRGSVLRVTRLDACGVPLLDPAMIVVSKRISTITINETTDKAPDLKLETSYGDLAILGRSTEQTIRYDMDLDLCGVDPGLIHVLTNQEMVTDRTDDEVGFGVDTKVDLTTFGFAIEVWSRIVGENCGENGTWGYTLFPFLKGGRIGGFSFENQAVSFTIKGARSHRSPGWGVGPHFVTRDIDGDPSPLLEPVGFNRAWMNFLTTLPPPEPQCGIIVPVDNSINGGNPFFTTEDVLDNQIPVDPGAGEVDGGDA